MWHVAVLTKPVIAVRADLIVIGIEDTTCRLRAMSLRLFCHLCLQGFVGLLVIRYLPIVTEEKDASRQEVDCRSLKELVRTATTFFLTLLE